MIKLNGIEVQFKNFPNGETELLHKELKINIVNEIVFKYENDSDLVKLLILKEYLDEQCGKDSVNELTLTHMPYARMDRSENNSAFTLKYISKLINSMNFDKIIVIEPHSDVTCALLNRAKANYINFDLIEKVKAEIDFDEESDYIMFPDAGAAKRYSKMKAKNVIIGNKKRNFETQQIESFELHSEFNAFGTKVIIVDDLSSYGGTFVAASKELKKEDFTEIYLLVAHAENSIFKGELFSNVKKVFTTDSMLTDESSIRFATNKNILKVYKLEEK